MRCVAVTSTFKNGWLIVNLFVGAGLVRAFPEQSLARQRSVRASRIVNALFGDRKRTTSAAENSFKSPTSDRFDWIEWEVYVDQTKSSLDKGSSATLDAFIGLSVPSVRVQPAVLPKNKMKGPAVRCIAVNDNKRNSFDVGNVDSVDKVYRVLTKHMQVKGISSKSRECLKWKYKANGYVEAGETARAIEAYGKALESGVKQQEGVILLMRSTAYLKSAASHKEQLKEIVDDLILMVPDTPKLQTLYEEASIDTSLANSIFRRVMEESSRQEEQFRRTQYRHGLYQWSLLKAAQDSLRATELLPNYATAWLRAGEILSELWKLKESTQYYERAIELDDSLHDSLIPVIDRLEKRQALLDNAREYGWSEDTLRLALDVAG